ncbi:conserved Plasmodium protein, unknown function [Plasmodium gallinaceum]|uniref:MINDY deubiquitinase domain-containing protein n=1 Tax=Plasmodium gallinaceum TaxID=5849 RepID=A0A1J1GYN7_PLAGA|nr:conserved Plasmodium protein, unknown function [Plasmodium gallinaceum]CRG97581.1 conserved Plasmodium protein, unknown function [Plasmodium gallinaceum]
MSSPYNIHYDEKNDEEENMIIKFADYETFKSYVLRKYDKIYNTSNYEKENINYYSVKWINFISRKVPILLQNKSGPCPLLCITNILLLRNQLHIDREITKISQKMIESKIMNLLLESNKKNVTDSRSSCNYRKNIIECVEILPQLKYGLDVNCKFTDIHSFEYTKGLCIFDMLNIPLYHGWVISSDDLIFYSYLKDYSYNVIINKIVRYNEYYEKKKRNSKELSNENLNCNVIELNKINNTEDYINDKKVSKNNIPIFPDDLDKNSEDNFKIKLHQSDIIQEKNDFFHESTKFESNNNKKTILNDNIKITQSLDSGKKIKNNNKLKNQMCYSGERGNYNNLPFHHENAIFYENDKNKHYEYSQNIPRFPEDTVSTNNLVENETSCKNLDNNIDTSIHEVFTNDNFFEDSNNVIKLTNDINVDNYTDNNTENSENFIMKNYNTEINLTPYEIHEALIMSEFLEAYKTQLTLIGLKLLQKNVNQNQLVAFFRNNHFNTLFKYENKLFLLATDISFLHLNCTWELFDNVENDTSYYDHNFKCLSNQKNAQKNINQSIIYSKNCEKSNGRNIYCLKSNSSISNKKKKKKKCTFM